MLPARFHAALSSLIVLVRRAVVVAIPAIVVALPLAGARAQEYRSIDGSGNNLEHPEWGSVNQQLRREVSGAHYADGVEEPAGGDRPNPRDISNSVFRQIAPVLNSRRLSDFVWQWGQFVDHDLDFTKPHDLPEDFDIPVPPGDPWMDPEGYGDLVIRLRRSKYDPATGTDPANPRQQINEITTWIDGSNVYGSDEERAAWLRTGVGGLLKTTPHPLGDLMPFNDGQVENGGGMFTDLFVAGDERANEQVCLTSLHTLFVREHNYHAMLIAEADPDLTDEEIYQHARRIVGAEIQAITFNEFLPALLGPRAIPSYQGYDPSVNPAISSAFSACAYRLGHTMISSTLLRVDQFGNIVENRSLALRRAFFNSVPLTTGGGIEPFLRGLAKQSMQEIDTHLVDELRNFLVNEPFVGAFDLAALNIQRGRDHGLADYNAMRVDFGLRPVRTFAEITSDVLLQQRLETVYGDVNDIDSWVGGLSEDHVDGGSVGELFRAILVDQFTRVRDGDRFWYQNEFTGDELAQIESQTLAKIIKRNTSIKRIQDNVFFAE